MRPYSGHLFQYDGREMRMKYFTQFAVLLSIAVHSSLACAEWVSVKDTGTQHYLVDTASRLDAGNGKFRVWTKTAFKNNPAVTEKQSYEEYDCQAGTIKTISVVVTVKSGSLVTQTLDSIEKATGNGVGAIKMRYLCEGILPEK